MLGKVIVSAHAIEHIVNELAATIDSYYCKRVSEKDPLVIICVLKGAVVFASDLIRKLQVPLVVEFVEVKSYENTHSTETIQLTKGLNTLIKGKHVLIVEGIVDTGLSMKFLKNYLNAFIPFELRLCSLLYKRENDKYNTQIDFLGTEVPNIYLIGYGLDLNGQLRNLTSIREWRE